MCPFTRVFNSRTLHLSLSLSLIRHAIYVLYISMEKPINFALDKYTHAERASRHCDFDLQRFFLIVLRVLRKVTVWCVHIFHLSGGKS